jgi:ribosomal-protein-alanine N-acetyltransferase
VSAPTLLVRDAHEADVDAILHIERSSFGDPWSADSFRSVIVAKRGHARVAELGGLVVGYCIGWRVGDEAELANLAVDPGHRRTGVAARLVDDLVAMADAAPGATLFLEVREGNEAAQALYRSRGFAAAGRRGKYYTNPTEDAVVMRRPARG